MSKLHRAETVTNEELIADVRAKFMAVSRRMQGGLSMKGGGAQAEQQYAKLYDRLAQLGGAPRLRKKYRG